MNHFSIEEFSKSKKSLDYKSLPENWNKLEKMEGDAFYISIVDRVKENPIGTKFDAPEWLVFKLIDPNSLENSWDDKRGKFVNPLVIETYASPHSSLLAKTKGCEEGDFFEFVYEGVKPYLDKDNKSQDYIVYSNFKKIEKAVLFE